MSDDQGQADELVRAFARWLAAQQASAAAEELTRRRWLAEQAAVGSTLVGILVDLAEQSAEVVLWAGESVCTGRLVGVGHDFCVISPRAGRPALVALHRLTAVRAVDGARAASGDRPPALEMSLAGALTAMAEERLPVAIRSGSKVLEGEVQSVGEDVVTLRAGAPVRQTVHVPLRAIEVCEVC